MKNFYIYLAILTVAVACTSSSKDELVVEKPTNPISGIWNLNNVYGGLLGLNQNYATGDLTLNFNTTTNTVVVNNTVTNSNTSFVSGSYSYAIQTISGVDFLVIDGINRGKITINSNLILDNNVALDGLKFKYIR